MISWLLYLPLSLLSSLLCYVTNPIVVLLCDENGELSGVWKYWQTWDDSCDSGWFMTEKIPSGFFRFLDYGYDDHYIMTEGADEYLKSVGRKRYYSTLIKPLSFVERVQRYFCRVLWLTRNCAYGFAFFVFGRKVDGAKVVVEECENETFSYELNGSWLTRTWKYKNDNQIIGPLYWKVFLGWKIDEESQSQTQAMIANRVAFKIKKEV